MWEVIMTKDEREELRDIQETLIGTLARVAELLGAPAKKPKPKLSPVVSDYDSESKERWIAR
jgi:hypothetical protein